MLARLTFTNPGTTLTIVSAAGRNSEENGMSNFGQKQHDDTGGLPSTPDSPKPLGDKLADAVRGAVEDGRPRQEGGASDSAPGTPDSPKPHGDKFASAVNAAAKRGQPGR
jgi:hypothetical protein